MSMVYPIETAISQGLAQQKETEQFYRFYYFCIYTYGTVHYKATFLGITMETVLQNNINGDHL